MKPKSLLISLALGLGLTLALVALLRPVSAAQHLKPVAPADPPTTTCAVTPNGGTTVYTSTDASAVQQAVDAAAPGGLLKIAGTCTGAEARAGLTQTVYISKSLTLQGGHNVNDWSLAPDPQTYSTTLDANGAGRVVFIPSGYQVTLAYLRLRGGDSAKGGGAAFGGGIQNSGVLTLTGSQVFDNLSNSWGGGLMNAGSVRVRQSSFYQNSGEGGGLFNYLGAVMDIADSSIYANLTHNNSGGIQNRGFLTLTNSTVSGNQLEGIYNYYGDGKTVTIRHSSIISNSWFGVRNLAGGGSGTINLENSILAYNGGLDCVNASVFNDLGYNLVADGSCITAGSSLSGDPLLGPLADNGGPATGPGQATPTHALLPGSKAIDHIPAGVNGCGVAYTYDQRGVARPQLGQCDPGAYEMQPVCPAGITLFVDRDANGLQDGSSWNDAYLNLQDGLFAANACAGIEEIWVATGVYTPGETVSDTFQLSDNLAIYGGFAATETLRTQRDWLANPTVLSGDIEGDDLTDPDGVVTSTTNISGTNSYHVVVGSGVGAAAQLDGFSITAGRANGSGANDDGGGMYNDSGSPTLAHLRFSGNRASNRGGGMCNLFSTSALTNVTFFGNSAAFGGGIGNYFSNPVLTNVTFSSNLANYDGGGMFSWAISNPVLTNVTFSGNSAGQRGGGIFGYESNSVLINVSFSGNSADNQGGGMYNSDSKPQVNNSILWNNQDSSGLGTITATIANDVNSAITLTHSLVQASGGSGAWIGGSYLDGGGNLDSDPWFVEPISPTAAPTTIGNLRPRSLSPPSRPAITSTSPPLPTWTVIPAL